MSLTRVRMSEEVWLTCLTHALSTETEEIMGLLLGDIQNSRDGSVTALIWGALPQLRSDRKKDRVETNPEQLTAASLQAEKMTATIGRTTRVIGWYHSHPHITVLPSHVAQSILKTKDSSDVIFVDVRTQAMYQLLDSGFIGLIFSCFSEDALKVGRIQVTAFQSLDGKQQNNMRPISLSPVPVIDLDSSISSSEQTFFRGVQGNTKSGKSSDLGGFFANVEARAGDKIPVTEIDPMDMSDSMQEALHRSTLEMSGADYVRKEVPLFVLPSSSLLPLDSPLESFSELQRVLYEEEKIACDQAIEESMRDGKVHPITYIHHRSTYQASLCKLIEYCLCPTISSLQDQMRENETQVRLLCDEEKSLRTPVSKGSGYQRSLRTVQTQNSPRNTQTQISPRTFQAQSSPRPVPMQTSPRQVQAQISPRNVQTQSSPRNLRSTSLRDRDLFSAGELSGKSSGGPSTRARRGS